MTPVTKRRRDGKVRPVRHRALQAGALVWLMIVWIALWGDLSVANVLGGLLVGVVVSLVFPLPPVRVRLQVHPLWLLWLGLRFGYDLVVASGEVAAKAVFLHREPRNAVVAVDLTTSSDLVLTIVAEMTSLVPGSLVVEARRSTHTLYLHVFDAGDPEGVERMRRQTLALEQRVLKAIGPGTTPAQQASPGGAR
jgi:multicomponent Na+:H+ antiporter subunit E